MLHSFIFNFVPWNKWWCVSSFFAWLFFPFLVFFLFDLWNTKIIIIIITYLYMYAVMPYYSHWPTVIDHLFVYKLWWTYCRRAVTERSIDPLCCQSFLFDVRFSLFKKKSFTFFFSAPPFPCLCNYCFCFLSPVLISYT